MTRHYYSEFDPHAAAWLRELIREGLIPDGEVDERDIRQVTADDLRGYRSVHLFAGVGGWPLALRLAGWPDDRSVWTGSCPCQPFSASGRKKGMRDERHLWPEMLRLVRECRPDVVFGEQVERAINGGWLDLVFDDLEGEGYACGSAVLPACSVGARHIRQRIWWVAHTSPAGQSDREGQQEDAEVVRLRPTSHDGGETGWRGRWQTEPGVGRVVHGVLPGNPAVRGYGNAIVPPLGAAFIEAYLEVAGA